MGSGMAGRAQAQPDAGRFAERVGELAAQGAAGVSALVDLTIATGAALSCSDIHLEPTSGDVKLRLRMDGVMQDFATLPGALAANIVARCKVMAGLLSYRTDIPQEGGVSGAAYGEGIELRISTFPVLHGERVAIRLFDPAGRREGLDDLGLTDGVKQCLERALARPEGLVLLCGPSGCGKPTTLYAALTPHPANTKRGNAAHGTNYSWGASCVKRCLPCA